MNARVWRVLEFYHAFFLLLFELDSWLGMALLEKLAILDRFKICDLVWA